MPNLTLADGLPVWEGAAVLYGCPGPTKGGRFYVDWVRVVDGRIEFGHGHSAPPDALVLDLDHQPTFLHLVYLTAEKYGLSVAIDPGRVIEFYEFENSVRVTLPDRYSLAAFWLNGPATAPE